MAAGKIHAHEADRDIGLVRRLLAAQFPQWAAQPIERVPSTGTDHGLYRLGDDQVVRLPLAWGAAKGLDKELTWLPRLARLLPVAIPVVLGTGMPAEGYRLPWAVYRWLDGENPRIDHIADPDLLATDLAVFIAALQGVDLADGPAAYRGGPLATQDAGTRAALAELGGVVDTEAATAAWDAALRTPEWSGPPVWVHADLMPGNVLVRQGPSQVRCGVPAGRVIPNLRRPAESSVLGDDRARLPRQDLAMTRNVEGEGQPETSVPGLRARDGYGT